jgi:mannose-6-phosphate isomerase-like protein (cupin superfamily)
MSISLDPPLEAEVDRRLPRGCQALDTQVLVAIAAGLAEVASPSDLRPGGSTTDRQYARILATESYEAWLIVWPPGTGLDLHDHGESAGAFAVVDGQLDETRIENGLTRTRRVDAGAHASFDVGQAHAVANNGEVAATSVHVYSPPLESMNFYVGGVVDSTSVRALWS